MVLEDYFDFLSPDDIRLRGHRIGIETVLLDYLNGSSPEEIACRYTTLNVEKVFATITYYWHKKVDVDAYLQRHLDYCREAERRYDESPRRGPSMRELRERLQAREAPAREAVGVA